MDFLPISVTVGLKEDGSLFLHGQAWWHLVQPLHAGWMVAAGSALPSNLPFLLHIAPVSLLCLQWFPVLHSLQLSGPEKAVFHQQKSSMGFFTLCLRSDFSVSIKKFPVLEECHCEQECYQWCLSSQWWLLLHLPSAVCPYGGEAYWCWPSEQWGWVAEVSTAPAPRQTVLGAGSTGRAHPGKRSANVTLCAFTHRRDAVCKVQRELLLHKNIC